jgi:hypothetical protein
MVSRGRLTVLARRPAKRCGLVGGKRQSLLRTPVQVESPGLPTVPWKRSVGGVDSPAWSLTLTPFRDGTGALPRIQVLLSNNRRPTPRNDFSVPNSRNANTDVGIRATGESPPLRTIHQDNRFRRPIGRVTRALVPQSFVSFALLTGSPGDFDAAASHGTRMMRWKSVMRRATTKSTCRSGEHRSGGPGVDTSHVVRRRPDETIQRPTHMTLTNFDT